MTDKIMRQNLFVVAQAYAYGYRIKLTTVSKKIHGNGDFFAKFIAGEISTGVDTYFLMLNRMRATWPKKTRWPRTSPMSKLGKKVDAEFEERLRDEGIC